MRKWNELSTIMVIYFTLIVSVIIIGLGYLSNNTNKRNSINTYHYIHGIH